LKDHHDLAAAKRSHSSLGAADELLAVELDRASHDAAGFIDETKNGAGSNGFSRSRFADEPQNFTGTEGETHPIDGLDHARAGEEMGTQICDGKDRLRHGR